MRIAYVCVDPGIAVFGTKGASVHIQEVVRELRALGHEVEVHALRRGSEVPRDLSDLKVCEYLIAPKDGLEREHAQEKVSQQIVRAIREGNYDLVYERYSLFSTVIADLAVMREVPGILEVNAPLIDEQRQHRSLSNETGAWRALERQAHAARAVICVSDLVKDWVMRHAPLARAFTVANGVSVTRITPQPEDSHNVIVTFVGTLKPWHGVEELLRAAALRKENWKLRIIGDGPERQRLQSLAAELSVDADFRGAIAPEHMMQHLAGSAIGVAPYPQAKAGDSYFSPLKVYEYLAAGLPVVASDIGQIPQILDDFGVLVPPSDPARLAQALDELSCDRDRRAHMGKAGRTRAEERHSWQHVVRTILQLAAITHA
ncbi:glycosyltransferase family 4 protein [Schaalia suimastitidis]|uniref:glycosyltransferase family 4 protein n=1 Tax=Schaalia suimastitidis TaxID=121163 RepID=UPI0003FCEAED|nr:glycosyltransferase family 4 protein [Schaalia suimastitidis]